MTSATEAPQTTPLALAHALSASPIWTETQDAILVVRSGPPPILGVLGYFDTESAARVEAMSWQIDYALAHLHYVSYAQAEDDCAQLAAQLVERFGRDELQRLPFVAIPRGGLIVLGMLAYVLGLNQSQLESPHPPDAPLVVVDDCAVSGARFRQFLKRCDSCQIIFAHLYSHPDLRAAIEAREPTVLTCVSARDLHDHARQRLGDGWHAWRERWLARSGGDCYWVGQPDHVCFSWNEPDITIWNPVTQREDDGWRIVPPEFCLKNRPPPGTKPARVQVQLEGKGPLKPAARTLFGDLGGQIVVADVKTGVTISLTDLAADMWQAIVEHGNPKDVVLALLKEYDVAKATLRADLDDFIGELLALGLVEESGVVDGRC